MDDNIPVKNAGSRNNYYRDDNKTKPTGTAGAKNFNRIMEKDSDREGGDDSEKIAKNDELEEQLEAGILSVARPGKTRTNPSLFDLTANKAGIYGRQATESELVADSKESGKSMFMGQTAAPRKGESSTGEPSLASGQLNTLKPNKGIASKEEKSDSPANLFAKLSKPAPTVEKGGELRSAELMADNMDTVTKKKASLNPYPQEHVDLAVVNVQGYIEPAAAAAKSELMTGIEKPQPVTNANLQVLLDRMAKEISVMTTEGKSETTVTLRQPPIFEGAQLTITGFESAKGELNIKFSNLTQPAQQLLQQEQHNLLSALEAKGYQVHIFTATTYLEEKPIVVADLPQGREQQRERGEGKGQRREEGQEES